MSEDSKKEADRLRALIDAVPVVLVSLDRDLRYLVANRFYAEHYGRERDLIGKYARDVLGDAQVDRLLPALERALAGEAVDVEAEVARPGATPLTVVARYIPMHDERGAVDSIACFSQDVTGQRALERELRLLADAIPHMVWVTSADGKVEYMNERWYAYTGMPAGSANEHWLEALHPDDLAEIRRRRVASLDTHTAVEMEYRVRRHDGAYRWHLARSVFVTDAAGHITKRFGTATDIHDHKMTEQRLVTLHRVSSELVDARSVEDTARALATIMYESLGATRCSVFLLDSAGLALERAGSRSRDDHPLDPGPFPLDAPLLSCRAVREKGAIWIDEASEELTKEVAGRTGMPEGALRAICALPLMSGERILGAVGMSFDAPRSFGPAERGHALVITRLAGAAIERAKLFEAEQRARSESERANRVKDEFLAMLGHELRNPLAPIRTTLDLMDARGDKEHVRERTVIERQVRHLSRLVDDLLDVSRIAAGRLDVERARIELADVVTQAVEMTMPAVEARKHHLAIDVPKGLELMGDRVRLAQVVSNLLANAAKYTPNGGHLAILARRELGEVVLTVRDDGIGIDAALMPRIFNLFEQGAQTSDRKQGGLGLGLAIARSLVELHHGSITARSEGAGHGTEVIVRLPLAAAPSDVPVPPAARSAHAAVRGNVLVVDDNEDAGDLLGIALEAKGFHPRVARDGAEALRVVDDFRPDVAILDLGLPQMDGVELGTRLRARFPDVRLVALTGYGQSSDRARTRANGFDEHLVKPVDLGHLERIVAALLRAGRPTGGAAKPT